MRTGIFTATLVALGLAGGLVPHASAQTLGGYPYQGRAGFSLEGTVSQIDADRDRVVIQGDDGHTYTVDTYRSSIRLRDTDRAGQTADLVPGMRLRISGTLLSKDLVEADRVAVQPYRSVRPTRPVDGSGPVFGGPAYGGGPGYTQGETVRLRGTVDSVDNRRGAFSLHINGHTRRIFVGDDTDLSDLNPGSSDRLPLRAGDRVSVIGQFQDDGTILASLVTPRQLDASGLGNSGGSPYRNGRQLTGRVSQESSFFSRDIKVRVSPDREVKVSVGHDVTVRRDGRAASVHDLKKDDRVRISGQYDGDTFDATRIDVLADSGGQGGY